MKLLEDKIRAEGKVLTGNILKVSSFLNHRVDTALMTEMGKEAARLYSAEKVDKVLTIEASGIPFAFAAAQALGVPMVFAKKRGASNVSGNCLSATVHSFTHGQDYTVVVDEGLIAKGERVLLADDFLAVGNAINGLVEITKKAGATVVGCVIAIEKGFQHGGDELRAKGLRVDSLALIDRMDPEDGIEYRL